MKHARFVLLIVLAVCLLLTGDLLYNYLNATFVEAHDGIVCTGLFSRLVFGENWTLSRFCGGFLIGVWTTLAAAIANIVLCCVELYRKK